MYTLGSWQAFLPESLAYSLGRFCKSSYHRTTLMEMASSLSKLWNEWQLRALILLSLTLQVMLVLLGNRRKYIAKFWITAIVWSAYLAADSVAIASLGILARRNTAAGIDEGIRIQAFWAPFLLLHLGGPDTITAYALEDNELWPRHLLQLAVQTGFSLYVSFMVWDTEKFNGLSVLTILVMVAGLIKYGERIWVLWSASLARLKQSKPIYGHIWTPVKQALADVKDDSIPEGSTLEVAYGLFQLVKLFLVDAVFNTKYVFECDIDPITIGEILFYKGGWKVIEVELGFVYDMLYTKAMVIQSICGICLRFTSFLLTAIVLVVFSSTYKSHNYSEADVYVTFLLLGVAILLELYAALALLASDRVILWFRQNGMTTISQAINSLKLFRTPRWSNSIGQFNLLPYYFLHNEGISLLRLIPKLYEWKQKRRHIAQHEVSEELKQWLVMHFQKESYQVMLGFRDSMDIRTARGKITLDESGYRDTWLARKTIELEFEDSIITWHIATEMCYHLDHAYFSKAKKNNNDTIESIDRIVHLNYKMSKYISRYMMHLVLIAPDKLPSVGARSPMRLEATSKEGWTHFHFFMTARKYAKEWRKEMKLQASQGLMGISTDDPGESLLGTAVEFAKALRSNEGDCSNKLGESVELRWKVIAGVWIEKLAHAAIQCKGSQHAQQLRQGGELLTHVWLLLAHLGITDHIKFLIPNGYV